MSPADRIEGLEAQADAPRTAGVPGARRWWEACEIGTAVGDEELAVFGVLTQGLDFAWLSVATIAARSGLAVERARAIVRRHEATGLILPHPTRPDLYGEASTVAPWLEAWSRRCGPQVA